MRINDQIVKEASAYVTLYLDRHLPNCFHYHNLSHTTYVVNAVGLLCSANGITGEEQRILKVAAWFHDIGFTKQALGHEKEGALMASHFLERKNISEEETTIVTDCILATQMPQQPANLLQQILCDADLLYLADMDMIARAGQLRKEWAVALNKVYTDKEWYSLNVQFLLSHKFHTEYCQNKFNRRKMNNINKLTKILQTLNANNGKAQNNIAA